MKNKINIFLFHRDLRIHDNLALNELIKARARDNNKVLFLFCFNPDQVSPRRNAYFNKFAIQFMCESLLDINAELQNKLLCMYGDEISCVRELMSHYNIDSIYTNADITPYAVMRGKIMHDFCIANGIDFCNISDDFSLFPLSSIKPVKAFHLFKQIAERTHVNQPITMSIKRLNVIEPPKKLHHQYVWDEMSKAAVRGGRQHALKILQLIQNKSYTRYDTTRNEMWNDSGTTKLSAYLKFGCISVREMYWVIKNTHGKAHGLINELYWRTYFDHLCIQNPTMLQNQISKIPNEPLSDSFKDRKWTSNKTIIESWVNGKTGIPIIDAAMSELRQTGYMHNRCRMIVAMYAVRNLNIDWRVCEKHFAKYLIDIAPAQNVGNWNWIMSYRFTFNPWVQQRKFDPECVYVKRWLPKLGDYDAKTLHDSKFNYIETVK